MAQRVGSFLALVAFILALAYGVEFLWGDNAIVEVAATALKTLGWGIFWGFSLLLRMIGEVIAAFGQATMEWFQGQASWLPNVPPLF